MGAVLQMFDELARALLKTWEIFFFWPDALHVGLVESNKVLFPGGCTCR